MGIKTWLGIFALVEICSQAAAQSAIEVSGFSATSKTVILKWTRYPGASSYKIYVAHTCTPNSPFGFVQYGANVVIGSVNFLSPNTIYVFTIEALDNSGRQLSTATKELSTAPNMMDPIHTVKPEDSTTLVVEFILVTGATNFILRIEAANGFFRMDIVSSSPAIIKNLTPYTNYTLIIMAVNTAGISQPSLPVTAKTALPPLQLSTSSPGISIIFVSWVPITHAVQYTLFIYKFGSNNTMTYNTTTTNMTVSDLDAGSLYSIKGLAWDIEGREGESSLLSNQTTRPPAPSSVSVSVVISNDVAGLSVSWKLNQEVYGSIQYLVTSDQNLTCNSTSTSCTLSPAKCGEKHVIQVTASNDAGPGNPSSTVVFTTFPCPPEYLALVESTPEGNCTLIWNSVPHADSYKAFIKRGDGVNETSCNTTSNNCTYQCECGYTYMMSVFAFSQAGSSPEGEILNYTTLPCCPEDVSISVVSTDTLQIMWEASRGAELYETLAADGSGVILCNDTAPVCALSDLSCDTAYTVVVTPCNEISGCNRACKAYTKDTAPCMPTSLMITLKNSSFVNISWVANNRAATYTVSALGDDGIYNCTTPENSCIITELLCGSNYEFSVTASNANGQSLPSFSDFLDTEPCCPVNITVNQVTPAMTNVSWSHAKGAHLSITSLTSPRGYARCSTQDSQCLMGCITCGTNYTVTMELFSRSKHKSNCTYQGFSSSACCPSGVRLYSMAANSLRVYWRSTDSSQSYIADMVGNRNNYTCTASPEKNHCDVVSVQCGDLYHVVVAPLTPGGSKVLLCPQRLYSVTCVGSNVGTVIYRGKRSVD